MPKLVGLLNSKPDSFPAEIMIIAHHMSENLEDADEQMKACQRKLPEGFKLMKLWPIRQLLGEKYSRILVNVPVELLWKEQTDEEKDEPENKKRRVLNESK